MVKSGLKGLNSSYPVNTNHLYNFYTKSPIRLRLCINVIQMFCAYWVLMFVFSDR